MCVRACVLRRGGIATVRGLDTLSLGGVCARRKGCRSQRDGLSTLLGMPIRWLCVGVVWKMRGDSGRVWRKCYKN